MVPTFGVSTDGRYRALDERGRADLAGTELGIPGSTLSHHLEKLKNEDLVSVRRDGTFLWYSANAAALQELLRFLYAECCTRNRAIEPRNIVAAR